MSSNQTSLITGLFGSRTIWPTGSNARRSSVDAEHATANGKPLLTKSASAYSCEDVERSLKAPLAISDFRSARREDLMEILQQLVRQREEAAATLGAMRRIGDAEALKHELDTACSERDTAKKVLHELEDKVKLFLSTSSRQAMPLQHVAVTTPYSDASTVLSPDANNASKTDDTDSVATTVTEPLSTTHAELRGEILALQLSKASAELEYTTKMNEMQRETDLMQQRHRSELQKLQEDLARAHSEAASQRARVEDTSRRLHAVGCEMEILRAENHRIKHELSQRHWKNKKMRENVSPSGMLSPLLSGTAATSVLGSGCRDLTATADTAADTPVPHITIDSSAHGIHNDINKPAKKVTARPPRHEVDPEPVKAPSLFGILLKRNRAATAPDPVSPPINQTNARDAISNPPSRATSPPGDSVAAEKTQVDEKLPAASPGWTFFGAARTNTSATTAMSSEVTEQKPGTGTSWAAGLSSMFTPTIAGNGATTDASAAVPPLAQAASMSDLWKRWTSASMKPIGDTNDSRVRRGQRRNRTGSLDVVFSRATVTPRPEIAQRCNLHRCAFAFPVAFQSGMQNVPALSELDAIDLQTVAQIISLRTLVTGESVIKPRVIFLLQGRLLKPESGMRTFQSYAAGDVIVLKAGEVVVAPASALVGVLPIANLNRIVHPLLARHHIIGLSLANEVRQASILQRSKSAFTSAKSTSEFVAALRRFGSLLNGLTLQSKTAEPVSEKLNDIISQCLMDLVRESCVFVNGERFQLGHEGRMEALLVRMTDILEEELLAAALASRPPRSDDTGNVNTKDKPPCLWALSEILMASSRTTTGGDTFAYVHDLLQNPTIAFVAAEAGVQAPVEIFISGNHVLIQSVNMYKVCAAGDEGQRSSVRTLALVRCRMTDSLQISRKPDFKEDDSQPTNSSGEHGGVSAGLPSMVDGCAAAAAYAQQRFACKQSRSLDISILPNEA